MLTRKIFIKSIGLTLLISILATVLLASCTRSEGTSLSEEQTSAILSYSVEGMQFFRIAGEESSNTWVAQREGNLYITGFVNRATYELCPRDDFKHLRMFVPEEVAGTTVYHVIPFVETSETTHEDIDASERSNSFDDSKLLDLNLPEAAGYKFSDEQDRHALTQAVFSMSGGQIHAVHLAEYANVFYRSYEYLSPIQRDGIIDAQTVRRELREANLDDSLWLDVSEGEVFELTGVASGSGFEATHLRIPARLGTAAMYRVVRVYGLEESRVRHSRNTTIPVALVDNKLTHAKQE